MGVFAVGESWSSCGYVDCRGGAEVFRCLEDVGFLAVVERDGVDVVEGVSSEVDLPVLSIVELYAVVEHADVLATHAADVDGFDAAHAAVVFYLYAGEVAEGVGNGVAVEALEFGAGEFLRFDDFFVFDFDDRNFFDLED